MVPYLKKASKCSTSTYTPMHVPPPSPSRSVISMDSGGLCVKLHKQIVLLCSMAKYWQKPSKMSTSSSNECSMPWQWEYMIKNVSHPLHIKYERFSCYVYQWPVVRQTEFSHCATITFFVSHRQHT